MDKETIINRIENDFRKQVLKDKRVGNAYLLVHSKKLGVDLHIAEGTTAGIPAHPDQPVYMASVGKLFTAAIVAVLHEKGELAFNDSISKYLDKDLLDKLHVYKGVDYTTEIQIKHLLNQSSGLYDAFWPLLEKLLRDPHLEMSPKEAIIWGRDNLKTRFRPGMRHYYTDTNYYLLGLIVEKVTNMPFHKALAKYIFEPLGMGQSYMLGYSEPVEKSDYPMAEVLLEGVEVLKLKGYLGLDYAGGGIVGPLGDYLKFMKALVSHQLIRADTLDIMKADSHRFNLNIKYGYGIWMFTSIPLLLPKKMTCWGCVGVTGAFMFYHPATDSYIIGNFNDVSYRSKALQYMMFKIIKPLLKIDPS